MVVIASLAVAGVGLAGGASVTGPPPASQVVDLPGNATIGDGDIGVWERSILTLRADDSAAQETIPIGEWVATDDTIPEVTTDIGPVGVYDEGQTVPVTFDASAGLADSAFANESISVYAVAGNGTADLDVNGTNPSTAAENGLNATSIDHVETTTLDGDGTATVQYTADEPGPVQLVAVVTDGSGANMSTNATVVGFDAILVESSPPSVTTAQTARVGDNVTMNVVGSGAGSATHAVVLYDESTLADSEVLVRASGSNVTIEPTIDRLNVTASASTENNSFDSSQSVEMASLFGMVGGPANESVYADGSPSETVTLDASAVARSGSGIKKIEVPTDSNWSTGTYRWVHVGQSGSTGVATGTVTLKPEKPSGPPQTPPGNVGGGGEIDIPRETTTVPGGGAEPKTTTTTTETTTTTTTETTTTTSPTFVERTPTTSEGPGFGAVMALVALVAVALLGLRRR